MYNGFDYHKAMEDGHAYNHYVADLLRQFGVPGVLVPEFSIARTSEEILDKTKNEKDVLVDDLVIEVKASSRAFKNAEEFPYNPIIVDTVYGYDSKVIKPLVYIIVSQVTKGMFVIPTASKPDWTIRTYKDVDRNIEDRFYMTNKRHCRPFIEFVDLLLERADERANTMQ
jgi:hypothetical protein